MIRGAPADPSCQSASTSDSRWIAVRSGIPTARGPEDLAQAVEAGADPVDPERADREALALRLRLLDAPLERVLAHGPLDFLLVHPHVGDGIDEHGGSPSFLRWSNLQGVEVDGRHARDGIPAEHPEDLQFSGPPRLYFEAGGAIRL